MNATEKWIVISDGTGMHCIGSDVGYINKLTLWIQIECMKHNNVIKVFVKNGVKWDTLEEIGYYMGRNGTKNCFNNKLGEKWDTVSHFSPTGKMHILICNNHSA